MAPEVSSEAPQPPTLNQIQDRLARDGVDGVRALFQALDLDTLIACSRDFWGQDLVEQAIRDQALAAFDRLANEARAAGEHDTALRGFSAKLEFNPRDQNVRFAVAEYLWRREDTAGVLDMLRPTIDLEQPPGAFQMFVRAALAEDAQEEISGFGHHLIYNDPTDSAANERIREATAVRAAQQLEAISRTGEVPEDLRDPTLLVILLDTASRTGALPVSAPVQAILSESDVYKPAAEALAELHDHAEKIATKPGSVKAKASRSLLSQAVRAHLAWSGACAVAHHQDPRVVAAARTIAGLADAIDILLRSAGPIGLAWAYRQAVDQLTQGEVDSALLEDFIQAEQIFDQLETRRTTIAEVFPPVCGNLINDLVGRLSRATGRDLPAAPGEAAAPAPAQDAKPVRIFYIITWHADDSSLVREISALYDPDNFYLVIVGGSNRPEQIDGKLWLMSKPNILLMNGAPTAWGGRTLLFENVFKGLELFRKMPEPYDWVQILCNNIEPETVERPLVDHQTGRLEGFQHPALVHADRPQYAITFKSVDRSLGLDVERIAAAGMVAGLPALIVDEEERPKTAAAGGKHASDLAGVMGRHGGVEMGEHRQQRHHVDTVIRNRQPHLVRRLGSGRIIQRMIGVQVIEGEADMQRLDHPAAPGDPLLDHIQAHITSLARQGEGQRQGQPPLSAADVEDDVVFAEVRLDDQMSQEFRPDRAEITVADEDRVLLGNVQVLGLHVPGGTEADRHA